MATKRRTPTQKARANAKKEADKAKKKVGANSTYQGHVTGDRFVDKKGRRVEVGASSVTMTKTSEKTYKNSVVRRTTRTNKPRQRRKGEARTSTSTITYESRPRRRYE